MYNTSNINSSINSKETALNIVNSKVQVTATDIKGKVAIDAFNSKLDFAAVNISSLETSILSRKTNEILFSLTTLRGPISNKVIHRKVIMLDNNKL